MLYLLTRYLTYFLQFITSIFIAVKLGPYYYGVWGFILLLLNYFRIVDFGISNSLNILLIQNKNDEKRAANLVISALGFIGLIGILILLLAAYYYFFGMSALSKYDLSYFFYIVCVIAIFQYINTLFSGIYRIKNRLLELSVYQSSIPFLIVLVIFFADDRFLLKILLGVYLLAHSFSLFFFIYRKQIPFKGNLNLKDSKTVISKGFYLFIYNCCFYLMLVSSSTIVSVFYSVEEYGYYTFAYMLGHSVILFLEAFTFIIFPKVIDKFHSDDYLEINRTITSIRVNYISLSHGLMYVAYAAFPFFIYLIPKYQDTLTALNVTSLAILLYANAFGYNSFLMAKNQEKTISKISLCCLLLNITVGLLLASWFQVGYMYIIIGTMIGYFLFAYLCVFYGKRFLGQSTNFIKIMHDCLPINLCIPYLCAIIITMLHQPYLSFFPLMVFIIFNLQIIKEMIVTIRKIVIRPDIIEIDIM